MYKILRIFTLLALCFLTLSNIQAQSKDKSTQDNAQEQSAPTQPVTPTTYIVKNNLKPQKLVGISQAQIDDHWKLYEGYVKQVNNLNQELAQLRTEGKGASLNYADRRRRYGFEYNGMILHEHYFENLGKSDTKKPSLSLLKALEKNFGSYAEWQKDFESSGRTRGIGWALLCADPVTKELVNIFVDDHEIGTIAGFNVILAMDVWEHAYMVDHRASGRSDYITAFMNNIKWDVVNKRYETIAS